MTISKRNSKRILDDVRSSIGRENLASSCSRDGCRVHLDKINGDRVIADMDLAFDAHQMNGQRCDFVFYTVGLNGYLLALPMELKSGDVRASDVLMQLQGGVDFVKSVTPQAVCHPVLFHGGSLRKPEHVALQKRKFPVNEHRLPVIVTRCDYSGNLAQCLKIIEGRLSRFLD